MVLRTNKIWVAAVLCATVLLPCAAFAAETADNTAQTKADALKEQYNRASADKKSTVGEEYIDALVALAESLEAKKDFAGAQKVLGQALGTAATIKSDKSKALTTKLTNVSVRKTMAAKVDTLRNALILKPNDPETVKQLVDLLVFEFEDVPGAQDAAQGSEDKTLKKALDLAGKKASGLSVPDTKELANWYLDAVKRTTGTTKAAAQAKAAKLLKDVLERKKLEPGAKTQFQSLFDTLPAEAKMADQPDASAQDAPVGVLTPMIVAGWIKAVPKDVSAQKPNERSYSRYDRIRDYIQSTKNNEMGKTFRCRGTMNQRVSFRKSDSKWEAELYFDVDMPTIGANATDAPKFRSQARVTVTEAQMNKMSELSNMTVEIEGKLRSLYIYSTGNDGQSSVVYGLYVQDGKLLSFK